LGPRGVSGFCSSAMGLVGAALPTGQAFSILFLRSSSGRSIPGPLSLICCLFLFVASRFSVVAAVFFFFRARSLVGGFL